MKRHKGLFEAFASFENLHAAWRKARRGARNKKSCLQWSYELEIRLLQLSEKLRSGQWTPHPYRYFEIFDPKQRTISVAVFEDRVVHHALVGVLEPIFERCFICDSYATRKGKGTHAAILRAQAFLRHHRWYFKSDIDKYFDSIRHDTLLKILSQKIGDGKLLEVAEKIIRNGGANGVGLPIGNLTSQFLANVYLNPFDHFVQQQLKPGRYIRYMDDFVLFDADKPALKQVRSPLSAYLAEELGLRLKAKATFINSATNGLPFLGRRIFPRLTRIARPNLRRIRRRMDEQTRRHNAGILNDAHFEQSMNSYWAMLCFGDNYQLRKKWADR